MVVFTLHGYNYYWVLQTKAHEDVDFLIFMVRAFGGGAYAITGSKK